MKLTKKILIGSLAAFAIAMLTGCPGGSTTTPSEDEPYYGENKLGTLSANLVDDGDADETEGEITKFSNNNVTMDKVDGGVKGQAWKISQTGSWSELVVDLTDFYGRGKSFLVSAKVKNNPEAEAKYKDASFTASYCVYSGDVKNWADRTEGSEYYDFVDGSLNEKGEKIVGPWGGEKDVIGEEFDFTEDELGLVTELSDDWKEIKYIITSTEIEKMINNSGLYKMEVEFYAGKDGASGYSYLIDDISIIDLNSENERLGRTWVDPNAEPEPEEE